MGAEDDWTWPPSMDAVVAAPGSHQVLFENDDVRVLEVTTAAGHREPDRAAGPSGLVTQAPSAFGDLDVRPVGRVKLPVIFRSCSWAGGMRRR